MSRDKTPLMFKKMSELSSNNSYFDMHMHTIWTDGKNTMQEMILQAEENGLKKIAFTDHIRIESDYYTEYVSEVKKTGEGHAIKLFSGFEAKIKNLEGVVDISDDAVNLADFVIASVHRLPVDNVFKYPKEFQYNNLAELEKELSLSAIKRGEKIDVLGHCGGMTIATYGMFPLEYFEVIIEACKEYKIVFEFNYKYHYMYEKEIKNLLCKYDPYVSAGSDAHDVSKISKRSFI